jgi:serine protease Do
MKRTTLTGVTAAALVVAAAATAPPLLAQPHDRQHPWWGGGSEIGVVVRDLEGAELREGGGVFVQEVGQGTPAEKGGLRRADIVTSYDGEKVRSARQYARLVEETPGGRTVRTTVVRQNKTVELSITTAARQPMGTRLREELIDRFREFPFALELPERTRLGVTVQSLTPQLATFFGAKSGLLVSEVAEDSPAARAGLRAGDVIVSVDGETVHTPADMSRRLRRQDAGREIAIDVIREKKEMSLKARVEPRRP